MAHHVVARLTVFVVIFGCSNADTNQAAPVDQPTAAANGSAQWPSDQDASQISVLRADVSSLQPCSGSLPLLTSDSLGPLHAGMTVGEARSVCPSFIAGWDWGDEGIPEPAILVRLGDAAAEIVFEGPESDRAAYAVVVSDTMFRTERNLGPGSSYLELLNAYGHPQVEIAECTVWAVFPGEDQLSWRIRTSIDDCARVEQLHGRPDSVPPTSRVITVSHVRRRGPNP